MLPFINILTLFPEAHLVVYFPKRTRGVKYKNFIENYKLYSNKVYNLIKN